MQYKSMVISSVFCSPCFQYTSNCFRSICFRALLRIGAALKLWYCAEEAPYRELLYIPQLASFFSGLCSYSTLVILESSGIHKIIQSLPSL